MGSREVGEEEASVLSVVEYTRDRLNEFASVGTSKVGEGEVSVVLGREC